MGAWIFCNWLSWQCCSHIWKGGSLGFIPATIYLFSDGKWAFNLRWLMIRRIICFLISVTSNKCFFGWKGIPSCNSVRSSRACFVLGATFKISIKDSRHHSSSTVSDICNVIFNKSPFDGQTSTQTAADASTIWILGYTLPELISNFNMF